MEKEIKSLVVFIIGSDGGTEFFNNRYNDNGGIRDGDNIKQTPTDCWYGYVSLFLYTFADIAIFLLMRTYWQVNLMMH